MRKGQTKGEKGLNHLVWTRINEAKFKEIKSVLSKSKNESISSIIRKIIYQKPIRVYVHDESMDITMEELAAIRAEIKSIGVNINQITKLFNTYSESQIKAFYAKVGYKEYMQLQNKIDCLLLIVAKLGKKWLSK